ncbi:kinase-like protein [Zopfia rhizophila CBS 207.26]|uniref:Kinase-like protein n=1 Tax=Zopfia rhizophila CBS 207.26 TaxID=1314779 RepID=A0A6A6E0G1_9PEZI|nr:kinase-like protein [Zopfia rhizophila CBS 207.26]
MASGTRLKDLLKKARVECPPGSMNFIVPDCDQKEIIAETSVKKELEFVKGKYTQDQIDQCAREVCGKQPARQLYATLAYMRQAPRIFDFLADGVRDKDLPLKRDLTGQRDQFILRRNTGETVPTLESWEPILREKFYSIQRMMASPFFKKGEHYDFDSHEVLPFIDFDHDAVLPITGGGYSEILIRCIHPSHHDFWDSSKLTKPRLVAIKRLISDDEKEFRKEESILKTISSKKDPHPHLIQLFATFRILQPEQKWHLIFPYADSNLRNYWRDRPEPNFDKLTVLWSLRQMCGIAQGLNTIHNFSVTIPLDVEGAGNVRKTDDGTMSVKEGEQYFGRHGDIKPENILWFCCDPDYDDNNGVLKIADFGLGRFHGRDSRSRVNPKSISFSPTYEPPEVKLGRPVSRAYDIWSLACLYLEYVTWLLMGNEAIFNFSRHRLSESRTIPSFSDDSFYTTSVAGDTDEAEIREGVNTWVDQLRQENRCSAFIHALLDLVTESMLRVSSADRINATQLAHELKTMSERGKRDEKYLLQPKPWTARDSIKKIRKRRDRCGYLDRNTLKTPTWSTIP